MIGLTKSVAADFVKQGIRCNAICPGTIETPSLQDRIAANAAASGGLDRPAAPSSRARRWAGSGTPEEIAALAVYLAADESQFVTGQAMVIDGGWTL